MLESWNWSCKNVEILKVILQKCWNFENSSCKSAKLFETDLAEVLKTLNLILQKYWHFETYLKEVLGFWNWSYNSAENFKTDIAEVH